MKRAKPHTGYLVSAVSIPIQEPTHYMVHKHLDPGVSEAAKLSKEELIALVEQSGLPVYVWLWDYTLQRFVIGKQVHCAVDYQGNKYLWINTKDRATKDLRHLIKIEWFETYRMK